MGCRCNRETERSHLCHGQGYTCPNLGKMRLYQMQPVSLAGMQMKLQVQQTIACDACWAKFQASTPKSDTVDGRGFGH